MSFRTYYVLMQQVVRLNCNMLVQKFTTGGMILEENRELIPVVVKMNETYVFHRMYEMILTLG